MYDLILPDVALPAVAPAAADNWSGVSTDAAMIDLWLSRHTASAATQRAYRGDLAGFRAVVPAPLRAVTAADMARYAAGLTDMAGATRARRIASIKSLFSFAHRVGYLSVNVGGALDVPSVRDHRAQRIMAESEAMRLLAAADGHSERASAVIRVLYSGGFRISELQQMRWQDLTDRGNAYQVSVFGKGNKTRQVLVYGKAHDAILRLRKAETLMTDYVFGAAEPISQSTLHRLIKAVCKAAGLRNDVSAHWLRHAHASHALARGANIETLQATLGHSNLSTTSRYVHARPNESSGAKLAE